MPMERLREVLARLGKRNYVLDADGNYKIGPELARCIRERPLPRSPVCLGVAVQEFEAWLQRISLQPASAAP